MLLLLVSFVYLCSSACVRDDYTSLPAYPAFPTVPYSGSVGASANYVKDHWSEMARIGNFRPRNTTTQVQNLCPHLGSGLVDWHDSATWGGSVPANGADVTIPGGKKVLVSSCSIDPSFVFGLVTIPADSQLIFGDAAITFNAHGIRADGSLLIGSPSCRLRNQITITLYGSRNAQALPASNFVKGIVVTGQIDIHGVEYFPTWTRLASTVNIGDTTVFIQDCPNWQIGQKIVVTTTELKDSRDFNHNEVRTITGIYTTTIASNVCAVTVDTAFSYTHYGGFEYQAEVSLISRNIVVQGDATNSEPTDTGPVACVGPSNPNSTYPCEEKYVTGFGVHIMVTAPATWGRFSGLMVYRGGQTNQIGKYPIHFHMLGNLTLPDFFYASDCSIYHSFFRCFAIHGTSGAGSTVNGVVLTKNTAFDAIGHCFFAAEDGVEENNTITFNFAGYVHSLGPYWQASYGISTGPYIYQSAGQSFGSQYTDTLKTGTNLAHTTDVSASPYYFTNGYSIIIGNAASGGWSGFSFPNLIGPVGLHTQFRPWFTPKNRPIIQFQGNSAHSTGFWQGHAAGIYLGGNLNIDSSNVLTYTAGRFLPARQTCLDYPPRPNGNCYGTPAWLQFFDTKVFLSNVGLQSWGDRSELIRFEVHDVSISTNVFGQVWIDQMLVDCRSGNQPLITKWSGCTASSFWNCNSRDQQYYYTMDGFQFYDTGQTHIVTNSVFKNCNTNYAYCKPGGCNLRVFLYLTHSDEFTPGLMQATRNISYSNVNISYITVPSTTLAAGATVSGRNANWMDWDGTVTGLFPGVRTNIGSNWPGADWWRLNSNCVSQQNNWVCPMNESDSVASMLLHWDLAAEANIGNTICFNGGTLNCPIGGKVTHFGRSTANAFDLATMPRLAGPLIASQGGWLATFIGGTPKSLYISDIQVRAEDLLHLAIPYPTGTTFDIYAKGPSYCNPCSNSWCPICRHNFTQAASIDEVRAGYGDLYYYDSVEQLLHIRVPSLSAFRNYPYFGTVANNPLLWNSTSLRNDYFSRGGVDLLKTGSSAVGIQIDVTSANCNPRCADITVTTPPAMPFVLAASNAPTQFPTTASPTDFPTTDFSSPSYTAAPTPPLAPTESPTAAAVSSGLDGGQIAGIVIGSLAGVAILLALALALFFLLRRRK